MHMYNGQDETNDRGGGQPMRDGDETFEVVMPAEGEAALAQLGPLL